LFIWGCVKAGRTIKANMLSGGSRNLERGFSHWRTRKFLGCHAHFRSLECIHDERNYCHYWMV